MSTLILLEALPDIGHVRPMRQLAKLLATTHGLTIRGIVPAPVAPLLTSAGIETHALQGIYPKPTLIQHLAEHPILYTAFSNNWDLWGQWTQIQRALDDQYDQVLSWIADADPALILGDVQTFGPWYQRIARAFQVPCILLSTGGLPETPISRYVRAYGQTRRPSWQRRLIEFAGHTLERFYRRPDDCRVPATVVAGLSTIDPYTAHIPSEAMRLAPLLEETVPPISATIDAWLSAGGPTALVSFGTMLRLNREQQQQIIDGLLQAGYRVLWVDPLGFTEVDTHDVRITLSLEQASILREQRVNLFVTHAGMNGTQEALAGGVPMLCIPVMWDQPYIASVVTALGAGEQCWLRQATAAHIRALALRLMQPDYFYAAREIKRCFQILQDCPAQTAWLQSVLP